MKKKYKFYFDNTKEEIERDYLKESDEFNMIKIIINIQVNSFNELFKNCKYISSIRFKGF